MGVEACGRMSRRRSGYLIPPPPNCFKAQFNYLCLTRAGRTGYQARGPQFGYLFCLTIDAGTCTERFATLGPALPESLNGESSLGVREKFRDQECSATFPGDREAESRTEMVSKSCEKILN